MRLLTSIVYSSGRYTRGMEGPFPSWPASEDPNPDHFPISSKLYFAHATPSSQTLQGCSQDG